MGIIRNAANRKIRGRVGDTTYYVSMDRQIARQALNSSNYGESARRTEAQQSRRVKWSNLVNFYKVSKSWMPKAFESKKKGQTDYNRFVSININTSSVALTRDQALQGGCVVEPFVITQGSLPSINITSKGSQWLTDIALGDLTITESLSVADFSKAVIDNNTHIKDGMQLSFVSYQQFTGAMGVPQVVCTFYEVTLDVSDTSVLRGYLPEFCAVDVDGYLATSNDISVGAFAYILSDSSLGNIRVSSQSLVNNNSELIDLFSSTEQFSRAIASYGVDTEVVLSPISRVAQGSTEQPISINYWSWGFAGLSKRSGDVVGPYGSIATAGGTSLNMSGMETNVVSGIYLRVYGDSSRHYANNGAWSVTGDNIHIDVAAWAEGAWFSKDIIEIGVVFADGRSAVMKFEAGTEDND